MITPEQLRNTLTYDPATGIFTWIVRPARHVHAGTIAGRTHHHGYRVITIDSTECQAHRLAWLYVHGEWPTAQIDHKNEVKDDNRIANLREASASQNKQNVTRPRADGSSGYLGVSWSKRNRRWKAGIRTNGHRTHLGYFPTRFQAHQAYLAAKQQHHPFSVTEVES